MVFRKSSLISYALNYKRYGVVTTTGGTAIRKGDVVVDAVPKLGEVLIHGVTLSPENPLDLVYLIKKMKNAVYSTTLFKGLLMILTKAVEDLLKFLEFLHLQKTRLGKVVDFLVRTLNIELTP